jgi:hypothetical protein
MTPQAEPGGAVRFALEDGLVIVPLQKHCCLVLSIPQYLAGIRRGKWWRRRQAMLQRTQGTPPAGLESTIAGKQDAG